MSKTQTNDVYDCSSDANFRNIWTQIASLMTTCGMVYVSQSAGEFDPTTMVRPAANNWVSGKRFYRDPGSLWTLAFEVGVGSSQTIFRSRVTIGVGSDGAGNLTGQTAGPLQWTTDGNATASSTQYNSYACAQAGYLGLAFKTMFTSTSHAGLLVMGSHCDEDGVPSDPAIGAAIYTTPSSGGWNFQPVRFANVASTPSAISQASHSNTLVQAWGAPPSSLDGNNNNQSWQFHFSIKTGYVWPWMVGVVLAEIPLANLLNTKPLGTTLHQYMGLDSNSTSTRPIDAASSTYSVAMRWED